MSRRLMNWRILLALFVCASVTLAPALADARAGASSSGHSSSMGSRGSRTYENNSAQPLSRSMTTQSPAAAAQPGLAPSPRLRRRSPGLLRALPMAAAGAFFSGIHL